MPTPTTKVAEPVEAGDVAGRSGPEGTAKSRGAEQRTSRKLIPSPIPCLYSYSAITVVKPHMREIYLGGILLGHELP